MHKNLCLRAAKYTQIQTASVFVSVCHRRILTHLAVKDPPPRDPHIRLGWSAVTEDCSQEEADNITAWLINGLL